MKGKFRLGARHLQVIMGDSQKYESKVDPRLPLVQDADLQDKIVLLRVVGTYSHLIMFVSVV